MRASRKDQEKLLEREIHQLAEILIAREISVRREQLSRGRSYRVKSGDCVLSSTSSVISNSGGDTAIPLTARRVVFVDKRLPLQQQVTVLLDYLVDLQFKLEEGELNKLSVNTQELLRSRLSRQAAA